MIKKFQYQGFSIFIDEKTISKVISSPGGNEITFIKLSEVDVDIILPNYIKHGEVDNEGYQVHHILMTSGNTRLDLLAKQVKRALDLI